MNLLVSTSIVAAFVAGVAALFAPCCITVLLPSYLGSIFRERRKVFLMTFIFFLGILVVFLPLGLGSALFSQFLSRYHNIIFAGGGLFLFVLGLIMVLGVHWSLPFHVNPTLKSHNAFSVFTLGIFSGIATTCCAPVLAGVLALSVLPGSVWLGGAYTLAYVMGMVAPLFVVALLLDKTQATQKLMKARRPIKYRLGPRAVSLSIPDLISGLLFIGMGVLTTWLALGNRLAMRSSLQVSINVWTTKFLHSIQGVVDLLPQSWWAALFALFFLGLTARVIYLFRKEQSYEPKQ
ncbi:MAG: cytochrome c biogenesis protein CcdA [Patescibacteria group bacterium]